MFRNTVQTRRLYAETSPSLIHHSAIYLVRVSTLPIDLLKIFTDPDGTNTLVDWPQFCWQDIYNSYYATPDMALASVDVSDHVLQSGALKSPGTGGYLEALVPDLIQTMAVVGDDELEPNYRELIYMQTGMMLPITAAEVLSSKTQLAGMSDMEVVAGERVGRVTSTISHSISHNAAAEEYGFICHISGTWIEPYHNQLDYSIVAAAGSVDNAALMYEEQSRFDSTVLAAQDEWILRLTDSPNALGDLDSTPNTSEASINLFEGGSVTLTPGSRIPRILNEDGDGFDTTWISGALTSENVAAGLYEHYIDSWGGASVLTDLGLF